MEELYSLWNGHRWLLFPDTQRPISFDSADEAREWMRDNLDEVLKWERVTVRKRRVVDEVQSEH